MSQLIKIDMVNRIVLNQLSKQLGEKKTLIIMGARQVGKSTLLQQLLGERGDVLWLNGDEPDVSGVFENISSARLHAIIGTKRIVVIDEAQRIPNIGMKIKLITDQIEGVQVIATGSSSFKLANKINEPLTGRKHEYKMYPLSFAEMAEHTSFLEEHRMIPHRLVYGYYPEVVTNPGNEKLLLKELSDSYLYKDILSMENILKADKLTRLLQALAHQIGEQVSYNEIGQLVGLDPKTVERYIDILEKSYVVFRLGTFSRNLRNELKKSRKVYFWDLGIRNAVIGNFAQIENRTDVGALWENFVISERMKKLSYESRLCSCYFWRTQQQQEIDLLEEEDGQLQTFEFKWNTKKKDVKAPDTFLKTYPSATFTVITPDNIEEILL